MQQIKYGLFCISALLFMSVNGAILSGHISTTDGTTPKETNVVALDVITRKNYTVSTTTSEYSLVLPDSALVQVSATGSNNVAVDSWTVPGYFPATATSVQLGNGNTTLDLSFEPCYTLVLLGYNSAGVLQRFEDFSVFSWAADSNGVPIRGNRVEIHNENTSTLGLSIPLNQEVNIMTEFILPGEDTVILPLNNNGKGFEFSQAGGSTLDINKEIATTAYFRAQQKNTDSSYPSIATSSLYNISQQIDSLSGSMIEMAARTMNVTTSSLYAETALELSKAQRAQYRRSKVLIKAVDQYGNSVQGLDLTIDTKSQDFRFGVIGGHYSFNTTQAWSMLAEAGVNSATVDFWWSATEPTSGTLEDSDVISERIALLLSLGFKLRATGLFQPSAAILPSYAMGLNFTQFGQALKDHVTAVVSKYCKQFEVIEVSTDLNILAQSLGFDDAQIQSLQQVSLRAIRSAAPGVRTSISTANTFYPTESSWLVSKSSTEFAKEWMSSGLSVDQTGVSIYNGVDAEPQYSLGWLSGVLDDMNTLGRTLRVSQFTVPLSVSSSQREQFLQQFYTVAYSKSNIAEITWANLIAKDADSIGLFNTDMTPTSLFYALKDTIKKLQYTSPISMDTNGMGNTTPTGGMYTVNVWKDGKIIGNGDVQVSEGTNNRMVVLYNSADNTAAVSINPNGGAFPGLLPAPAPAQVSSSPTGGRGASLPPWGIFLISFGTVVMVTGLVAIIIFAVVKRMPKNEDTTDIETSVPVGNVAPVSVDDVNISPETWTEGPLATVALAEEEDDASIDDSSSSSTDSDDMEDVKLDEEDVGTTPSESESDEEHL